MSSPLFRVLALMLSFATVPFAASSGSSAEDGPRVGVRLVVVDTYGNGMGRCSVEVKSTFNLHGYFLVNDSGSAMTRLFPGDWHVESVSCPSVKTTFPVGLSSFVIPDDEADLSLGALAVDFHAEDVADEVAAVHQRRRLAAAAVGITLGGVIGGAVASGMVDDLPGALKVNADADLRMRWNDRAAIAEIAAIMGHSDVKRIAVRIQHDH